MTARDGRYALVVHAWWGIDEPALVEAVQSVAREDRAAVRSEVLREAAQQLTDSAVVWPGINAENHIKSVHRAEIAEWFRRMADAAERGE